MKLTVGADRLWRDLHVILAAVAAEIEKFDSTLACEVACTSNDAFPVRAYLAVRRSPTGDELAVVVDVQATGDGWSASSDICTDDGAVVAEGPGATGPAQIAESPLEHWAADWVAAVRRFLAEAEGEIRMAAARLS
ncbi:hypothetical protein [Caldimonas brevitalea]|uniref:Uncharacterized protein n=1 Tax=Caldimonas brevitalea TaxID=413882 RepID=A0A0G3BQQ3_9BURK|nr:hypothetical protein [Caldimonas brevitalea]AKJ29721.1 hypothetical protein AAW51_3030 [Caldimonas brevitalea]